MTGKLDRIFPATTTAPPTTTPPSPASEADDYRRRVAELAEWLARNDIDTDPANLPGIIVTTRHGDAVNQRGWIFSGGVGSGKTRRAQIASRYAGVPLVSAPRIVEDAAVNVTKSNRLGDAGRLPGGLSINSRAWEFDLIIDDLGTEPSAFSAYGVIRDLMAEVLLARLNLWPKVRTYITTNLNKAELHARYGERIVSRLFQACAWIPITHPDRRAGN
jgi:hypothetical protein